MTQEVRLSATWQRWTIDEIDLGVVRLAVAQAQTPLESSVAEAEATNADPKRIRDRVFEVEDADPSVVWGDEQPVYMLEEDLRPLLKRRGRIRGLPKNRPLREGDVFWIVLPQTLHEDQLRFMTVSDVADTRQLDVQVWDVTAAARQVAKRTYDAAVRAATNEPVEQDQMART